MLMTPITGAGIEIYLSALPDFALYFHTDTEQIKWTLTAYLLGYGLLQPLVGVWADRRGRRHVLLTGIAAYVVFTAMLPFTDSIQTFLLTRFLQGCAVAPIAVIPKAVLNDCFEGTEHQKFANYIAIFWALGASFSPVLGSILIEVFSWQTCMIVFSIFVLLIGISTFFKWPETLKSPADPATSLRKQFEIVLGDWPFITAALSMSLLASSSVVFNLDGPFLVKDVLHLGKLTFGEAAFLIGLAWVLGSMLCEVARRHMSQQKIVDMVLLIVTVTLLITIGLDINFDISLQLFVVPLIPLNILAAMLFPIFMAFALRRFPDQSAIASACLGSLFTLGMAVFSILLSVLPAMDLISITLIHVGLFSLTGAGYFFLIRDNSALNV
ncbi:MAG: multidrug effflux MFS transporter [Desulfobulbaceae bacterium]|nr:multidrug effflux MFS transporter [Desulfobulbaceae bacterium]